MSNKWNYNENFMHAQNQPEWKDEILLPSHETIGAKGCFISCLTYILSRKEGINHEIPDVVKLVGEHMGFIATGDHAGDTIWSVVKQWLQLSIVTKRPLFSNAYPFVMRNVWLRGKNNQMYGHWVVELRKGLYQLMYDPMRTGGQFVHDINYFPPVRDSKNNINRRYVG